MENGFDFLGQHVRRYPNGKLLIKPSKKNVKTFLDRIGRIIKTAIGISAADLIAKLNPKIRGWANYHRHVVSKHTFQHVDSVIFCRMRQWARRRHPKKSSDWLKEKYFERYRGRDWSFFGETCDDEGQPSKLWLCRAGSTPIQRHVKVKSEANPYDPAYETYFEEREGSRMLATFRGTRTLRFLWNEQSGLCPVCNTKITRITGWRLHYCVPRVRGGSQGAENRVLLHPECHDMVHRQRIPVSNRVSSKEAFAGPELCDWKLSRTVLRGLDGSNRVRLLGKLSRPVLGGPGGGKTAWLLGQVPYHYFTWLVTAALIRQLM